MMNVKGSAKFLPALGLLLFIAVLWGMWFAGTPQSAVESAVSAVSARPAESVASKTAEPEIVFGGEAFRAVWIPYFDLNLSGDVHFGTFKQRADEILQTAQENGLNTVIVSVHPFCDAFYRSAYFPWSALLSGTRGKDPGFDAMAYWVSAAHAKGMSFHAWINPLRVSSSADDTAFSEHADWISVTENGRYLNPGIPEMRAFLCDWVREMVSRYAVDAVHLDDYFYPTRDEAFDAAAYAQYRNTPNGTLSLDDWRTENINCLVRELYRAVKETRASALFGISPAGNIENCLQMYADVRKWASAEGYVDYLCPQLYYNSENAVCPFEETARAWREMTSCKAVTLYAGLALYKAGDPEADNGTWTSSDDILRGQLAVLQELGYEGFALYAYDQLTATETAAEMANVRACIGAVSTAEAASDTSKTAASSAEP